MIQPQHASHIIIYITDLLIELLIFDENAQVNF